MKKISVIIPAHNEEKYLGQTLDSLRNQNFLDYETIIVPNGCSDQTVSIAQKYLNQSTKILPITEANVSQARNLGAQHAQGEILLFLDADTQLEPTTLQTIAQHFKNNLSVATTKTKPDNPQFKFKLALAFKNLYNQTKIYQGCSGALICRKEHFHSVGGYHPPLKVKEHRKLIIKLKKLGQYVVLPTYTTTSMRRFQHWGLTKATYFWLKEFIKNYTTDLKKSDYESVR